MNVISISAYTFATSSHKLFTINYIKIAQLDRFSQFFCVCFNNIKTLKSKIP